MSAFAVAAFHDARLPVGAARLDAVVWVRAEGIDEADVVLRVWTPLGAALATLRELVPGTGDLLAGAVAVNERTVEVPAGRWTAGVREYELAVDLPPCRSGDELLAARVAVVAGGAIAGRAQLAVSWCDAVAPQDAAQAEADVAGADLPTGRSQRPPAAIGTDEACAPCPGCGAPRDADDAYCEACGRELAGG